LKVKSPKKISLFKKKIISVSEAKKLFKGNPYKQEWLDEIEERKEKASVYWTADEFVDLCAGPHVSSTGEIGPFKLLSVAGAYWRGSEKNKWSYLLFLMRSAKVFLCGFQKDMP
jgi:threonyl-tRNA synthetase